jgi:hypothetical protein
VGEVAPVQSVLTVVQFLPVITTIIIIIIITYLLTYLLTHSMEQSPS